MMPLTGIVKHLVIINVVVFIAMYLLIPPEWANMMAFHFPATGFFRPYQIITYMFAHASVPHIFLNMLGLIFLGPMVEMTLGPKRFFGLYMISGFVALAAHFLMYYIPYYMNIPSIGPPSVMGASGAVYGVMIAFATLYPDRQLMLLFPPIPIKAWLMATILVGLGLYQGITGTGGNVAHFAHLGGALAGFILARHWKLGGHFLR